MNFLVITENNIKSWIFLLILQFLQQMKCYDFDVHLRITSTQNISCLTQMTVNRDRKMCCVVLSHASLQLAAVDATTFMHFWAKHNRYSSMHVAPLRNALAHKRSTNIKTKIYHAAMFSRAQNTLQSNTNNDTNRIVEFFAPRFCFYFRTFHSCMCIFGDIIVLCIRTDPFFSYIERKIKYF